TGDAAHRKRGRRPAGRRGRSDRLQGGGGCVRRTRASRDANADLMKSSSAASAARSFTMVSRPEFGAVVTLDAGNTVRVTMSNPRNGQQSCVDVFAHPADVADAVILFAHNQCICPTEVEMSTIWPKSSTSTIPHQ